MATYQPNIPQATDQQSVSQGDLLANFQALAYLVNPNALQILFPQASGVPAISNGSLGMYAAQLGASFSTSNPAPSVSGQPQLYLQQANMSTSWGYPFTAGQAVNSTGSAWEGWFYLPPGFLVKFGFNCHPGASQFTWSFPAASSTVPAFSTPASGPNPYTVILTPINSSNTAAAQQIVNLTVINNQSSFSGVITNGSTGALQSGDFNYIAIGY